MTAEHELNKDDSSRHTKVDNEKFRRPQPYAKNYRQVRETKSERDGLLQGRKQLVIQYQVVRLGKLGIHDDIHMNFIFL